MEEMSIRDRIIDYIQRNRVSTTEVADCLGKSGALDNVLPINRGHFKAGKVKWVYAYKETNWDVHEQVISVDKGDIVFIDVIDCADRAIIGELVSKYIILYQQAAAIVTNGKMRDAGALLRENYPIWCVGFSPVGCFNRKPEPPLAEDIIAQRRAMYDGAVAVCDDCGVVIVPPEKVNEEFLDKLKWIEEQEDIWFDRLDRKKENTFEIVCLKNYLKENNN